MRTTEYNNKACDRCAAKVITRLYEPSDATPKNLCVVCWLRMFGDDK